MYRRAPEFYSPSKGVLLTDFATLVDPHFNFGGTGWNNLINKKLPSLRSREGLGVSQNGDFTHDDFASLVDLLSSPAAEKVAVVVYYDQQLVFGPSDFIFDT